MQALIGLGNPGKRYIDTRHNIGYLIVDHFSSNNNVPFLPGKGDYYYKEHEVNDRKVFLFKPTTYMNHSGRAVSALAKYYKIGVENILVAHDELDLPAGRVRLKKGGGHGGHNGLRDIIAAMGGKEFWRLRIGIDHPGHRDQVVDYVLNNPSKGDRSNIDQSLQDVEHVIGRICSGEQQAVMNGLHSS